MKNKDIIQELRINTNAGPNLVNLIEYRLEMLDALAAVTQKYTWKSIKDGLPPVGTPLIVTIIDSLKGRRELRYPVYYQQSIYCDNYGFYVNGTDVLLPEYSEVIAYMELPNVYDGEVE